MDIKYETTPDREIGFKKSVDFFPCSLTSCEVIPKESLPILQENQLHDKDFSCSPSISSLEDIRNDFEYVKPDFPATLEHKLSFDVL